MQHLAVEVMPVELSPHPRLWMSLVVQTQNTSPLAVIVSSTLVCKLLSFPGALSTSKAK
jgi:hypothetical protein